MSQGGIAEPALPISYDAMYQVYDKSDVLRPIINTLKNEIFRTGLAAVPRFVAKCVGCETEYQRDLEEGEVCENCGSAEFRKPDWREKQAIESFVHSINANEQSLKELGKELEKDNEIVDEGYVVAVKQYIFDARGQIMGENVDEFVRGDPRTMRLLVDDRGRFGDKYTCINPRCGSARKTLIEPGEGEVSAWCSECGWMAHPVYYAATSMGGSSGETTYYIHGEVCHWSKYDPSLTYGTPPLITLWQATNTMKNMGKLLNVMYQGQRAPRRFIWMITKSFEGLQEWWDEQQLRVARDPRYTPILAVEGESKEGQVGVVDAMDSLRDMQFLEHKQELRERLSAFYGVSNVFQADVKVAGGLNNESRQIMVTDRAVEFGRTIFREKVFAWICRQKGWVDFFIDFHLLDERDEVTRLNLQSKRIANMNGMVAAGFSADMRPDGSFRFTGAGERVRSVEPGAPETPHMGAPKPPETEHDEETLKTGMDPIQVFRDEYKRARDREDAQEKEGSG